MGLSHSEFMAIFDQWAPSYDETVFARTPADGFEDYEQVLDRVARLAGAGPGTRILDVGAGTGNLSAVLSRYGAQVTAVDPSREMRRQAAAKPAGVTVLEGHFLSLPVADGSQDAVASTYAFHHLPDSDKPGAAAEVLRAVRPGGRVVLGDIAWADEAARYAMIRRFEKAGRADLVREIEEEYYPTVGLLTEVFARFGCAVYVEQLNDWVWVLAAVRRV